MDNVDIDVGWSSRNIHRTRDSPRYLPWKKILNIDIFSSFSDFFTEIPITYSIFVKNHNINNER